MVLPASPIKKIKYKTSMNSMTFALCTITATTTTTTTVVIQCPKGWDGNQEIGCYDFEGIIGQGTKKAEEAKKACEGLKAKLGLPHGRTRLAQPKTQARFKRVREWLLRNKARLPENKDDCKMRKPGVSLKTLLIDLRDGKKGRGHGGHYWGDDKNDLYTLKDAWQKGEPNDDRYGVEDCAQFKSIVHCGKDPTAPKDVFRLNDISCENRQNFLCEYVLEQ